MANDDRFNERRQRQYATARALTEQDIADNPAGFAGAKPGDLAVEQNGSGVLIVMTPEDFAAHYELATEATTAQLDALTARIDALEQRITPAGGQ